MNYSDLGYIRVAAVAPVIELADPQANAERICAHLARLADESVSIALFPELCVTGYTCEDLFFSNDLRTGAVQALARIASACADITAIVGLPWRLQDGRLVNCAAVVQGSRVLGLVPKSSHPNYGEFYDRRWFAPGADVAEIQGNDQFGGQFLVSRRQLFDVGGVRFGIEICEDLWSPYPPGIDHCLAGADLVFNLSASNELVAKADYRRELTKMASAKGICGYLYASSGASESSKDLVFGGHLLAAENGQILSESARFTLDDEIIITEFDVQKLRHDRMQNTTMANTPRPGGYQQVNVGAEPVELTSLVRKIDAHPFVPTDENQFDARATEILDIQATGLARRMLAAASAPVIGLSGGLDSTLAFLVCIDALDKLKKSHRELHALTMPGPGTSTHTRTTAHQLCEAAGVTIKEISIETAVAQHLKDLEHEDETDVVFENAQARERTQILFNYANKVGGVVVGTGDLSELALGWCTYNADHMAGYNVNASVPKTMMAYLVRWYARYRADSPLADVLDRVLQTPISPELIAPEDGRISQETEAIIGPYELHDFFLYHFMRNGSGVEKIFTLANIAFADCYTPQDILRWMRVFFTRFFTQQFKRTTLPPGPKVGSVSLSPRGDWRMPDEASARAVLTQIDRMLERDT